MFEIAISVIGVTIIVDILGLTKIPGYLLIESISNRINFYGIYSGAILGAFITLIIVHYEIKKTKSRIRKIRKTSDL